VATRQRLGLPAVQMTIHLAKHWLGESEKAMVEPSGPEGNPIRIVLSEDDMKL
jgi:hypothetical protein